MNIGRQARIGAAVAVSGLMVSAATVVATLAVVGGDEVDGMAANYPSPSTTTSTTTSTKTVTSEVEVEVEPDEETEEPDAETEAELEPEPAPEPEPVETEIPEAAVYSEGDVINHLGLERDEWDILYLYKGDCEITHVVIGSEFIANYERGGVRVATNPDGTVGVTISFDPGTCLDDITNDLKSL